MVELKQLSTEAIPAALEKALRYRLLNEPAEAESICHDVLHIDPENQQALVLLLLSLTDRFDRGYAVGILQPEQVLSRLSGAYERAYYAGISERRAKARLHQGHPGAGHDAYESLREAMSWYEQAAKLQPPGNDDALLRRNTCARVIMSNQLMPRTEETVECHWSEVRAEVKLGQWLMASGFT
jgi:tetratricopeptide (TPR) repeat protein